MEWRNAKKCNQCEYAFSRAGNLRRPLKKYNGEKSNKCNLCDFASSRSCHLRTHLKNILEKSKKNVTSVILHPSKQTFWPDIWIDTVWKYTIEKSQTSNASSQANDLRKHLKMHSGEKSSKCNQCDYASSQAGNLKLHLKRTVEKSQTNATNAAMDFFKMQNMKKMIFSPSFASIYP